MSGRAYPAYWDSGVDWIGRVPTHWSIKSMKRLARLVTDSAVARTFPVALENIEGWSGRYIETASGFAGDGVAFKQKDVLFGKLRPYLAKHGWPIEMAKRSATFTSLEAVMHLTLSFFGRLYLLAKSSL